MRACRLSVAVLVVALTASRAVAQPASAPATAPARGEIGRLIRELGDDRWAVREEATRRLREMGPAAAQALREALQSADLEVKSRSRKLLDTLALGGESDLAVARQKVLWAFRKADYGAAVEVARRVVNHGDSGMSDWLWLGHCCQLGGDWAGAAGAYRKVVEFLDADVQSGRKTPEAPEVPARRGKMLNVIEGNEGSWVGPVAPGGPQPLSDRERAEMTRQRTQMMLSIAHIQRHEMKAPAQAAKTLGEALDFLEAGKGTIDDGWMSIAIADERPVCLHEAGDLAGAVEAWKRAAAWRTKLKRVET
ncbi:MAG: hypothetical protein NTV86_23615, partial [Planctomycetota bacterium]|nr:hypothetical protein [Planctomycetota bacterium]